MCDAVLGVCLVFHAIRNVTDGTRVSWFANLLLGGIGKDGAGGASGIGQGIVNHTAGSFGSDAKVGGNGCGSTYAWT